MTRSSWRALAGLLTVSLGGFVVCANDKAPRPAAAKADPQCPHQCPSPCPSACPVAFPAPVTPLDSPVVPVIVPVARAEEPVPPAPACLPPCPPTEVPQVARPIRQVAMTVAAQVVTAIPYKVRMEMISGVTQVELLRGEDVALRVQCDRLDVQMPGGGLHATGKVCVTAPGIEVRCNRVVIGWHAGEIAMEGQVRIMCQNGAMRTEMTAESVSCKLSGVGGGLDFNARTPNASPAAESTLNQQ